MVGDHGEHPRNEDEAVAYWLGRLRDGSPTEQMGARTELALILERRGMVEEAIEGYQRNVMDGVRDRRPYDRLVAIYRERGDAASETLVQRAFEAMVRTTDSPTLTAMPIVPLSTSHSTDPASESLLIGDDDSGSSELSRSADRSPDDVDRDATESAASKPVEAGPPETIPADTRHPDRAIDLPAGEVVVPPPGQYAPAARRGQRPSGRPAPSPPRRGSGITPALGILIALVGLIVLVGSIIFALLWSGGRLGSGAFGALGTSRPEASVAGPGGTPPATSSTTTSGTVAGGTGASGTASAAVAAAPAQTPTPALPPAECWDPAIRFPESRQPEESVRLALLEYLGRQDASVDPDSPRVRPLLEAHAARADELMAGWMGVSLQRSQRRLQTFSLAAFIGSELLVPNEVGQFTLRPTISEQGWRELQAWPASTCEGAFIQRPENARWVSLMRASVGDISWALAPAPPAASPSPSPSPGAP